MLLTRNSLYFQELAESESKGIFHKNKFQKKAGVTTLISHKKSGKDSNMIIVEYLSHFQQWADHLIRKINRVAELNSIFNPVNLTDIFKTFTQIALKYTFLSTTQGTISGSDHMTGHKQISQIF
jgi:hypothetical protein